MAAAKSQPFFLFHCTQLPHTDNKWEWPAQATTKAKYQAVNMPVAGNKDDDLSKKPDYLKTVRNRTQAKTYGYPDAQKIQAHTLDYYSVVTEMDDFVGSILQKVKELGLEENTYIIFMSDNGWMLGDHGFMSKVLPYQASINVPMCVLGPGISPSVERSLMLNIDILPTILGLAKVKIPQNSHGKNYQAIWTGQQKKGRELFVYEGLGSYGGVKPNLTVVSDRFKYIVTYENNQLNQINFRELYDMNNDPHEMKNSVNESQYTGLIRKYNRVIIDHKKLIMKIGFKGHHSIYQPKLI